jgi:vacuolar-type H+-ATPase subunit E/Vma4
MELLKLTEYKKKDLELIASQVVDSVKDGLQDPLKSYIQAKALAAISDYIIKAIKEEATNEGEKYKGQTVAGVKVEVSNAATLLDYSQDAIVADLEAQLKERKEILKEATKMAEKGLQMVDENGEVVLPVTVKSYAGGGLKITFK